MEFTHRTYEPGQTIAAIATPPGEGGVGIIRISGDEALAVADKMFSGSIFSYESHTVHFGKIIDCEGNVIDEGLALVMRTPRSYTGEDTVEFHCHGGSLITKLVLKTALKAGARAAEPGEFTFKAFQNGKIDLTQAEAVQQVIASKNTLSMQAAESQLQGKLHRKIATFQKQLTDIAAILEAWVDFPEEGLEFASQEELLASLSTVVHEMNTLSLTFHDGKALTTCHTLCLLGAPNVGKSSLMNVLTGKERAIVTPIPGTTRDTLEDEIQLAGLNFRLLDTAGIRETDEVIEQEGIKRSEKAAQTADLILLVLDITDPKPLSNLPPEKTLAIWNKIDLSDKQPQENLPFRSVKVSAKSEQGIEELKQAIQDCIWKNGSPPKDEIVLTNERHYRSLSESIHAIKRVIAGLETSISPEFLVSDLRLSLKELGMIIGLNITEEVLSAIFSKFCVGK